MTTRSSCVSARGGAGPRLLIRWCLGITVVVETALLLGMIRLDGPPLAVGAAGAGRPIAAARPAFEEYPASPIFPGRAAPVDLDSHPSARMFRTRLRKGAEQGPNFAGHYTVVTWGCGTNCQTVAIVDSIDGRVFFPDLVSETGVAYRIDSRLLIENPVHTSPGLDEEEERRLYGGPNYYAWNGSSLDLVVGDDTVGLTYPAWAR
jgi:hypothetical protein